MSENDDSSPKEICVENTEKNGSKESMDNDEFATAVKEVDRDTVTKFLKNRFCLTDKIAIEEKDSLKYVTVIEYIMNRWPRPVHYLMNLFDEHITKNDKDIDSYDCEIDIDFKILLQPDGFVRSDMKILKTLLQNIRKYNTDLMNHPLISSFLYIKWISGLKFFYKVSVLLYFLFVLCLSWIALTIYIPTEHSYVNICYKISYFLITCMMIEEFLFIAFTIWTGNILSAVKKPIWMLNWISKALWIVVVNTDHSIINRDWPKIVTAAAVLFAWLEITVLLSHFPECGYLFHMFSVVVNRAIKVFFLFGFQIIMGFSLAFFVMFHDKKPFENFFNTFAKVVVMTSDLEYTSMIDDIKNIHYKIIVQVFIIFFIFFVPIILMNFLLALIITDVGDLKINGKAKRTCNTIELIDLLDNVVDMATSSVGIDRKKLKSVWKIYPGRPIRTDDVISLEVQEKMTNIFIKNK